MADGRSGGVPAAKGPASCIAPYHDRRTGIRPSAKVDIISAPSPQTWTDAAGRRNGRRRISGLGWSRVNLDAIAEVEPDRLQDREGVVGAEHVHGTEQAGVLLDHGRGGGIRHRVHLASDLRPQV